MLEKVVCLGCGTSFEGIKSAKRKYCSRHCQDESSKAKNMRYRC